MEYRYLNLDPIPRQHKALDDASLANSCDLITSILPWLLTEFSLAMPEPQLFRINTLLENIGPINLNE